MSLNFGEIVEPSTRAFWDDYDEGDEDLAPLQPLEWEWLNEDNVEQKLDNIKRLLILEGPGISGFAGTAVLKGRSPICQLNSGTVSIYYDAEKGSLVCVSEEKDLNAFGRITEKLAKWLEVADEVVAVSFQPSVMHKGTSGSDAEEVCFIRSINGQLSQIPKLDAPNVVTGLAGGALSYRKFKDQTASVYVCYLDSCVLDSISAKPILRLLKALSVECDDSYQLKFKTSSNLYL
ncbi:uncharacterized protein LOC109432401 [Aedes albopictus]|uniref:Proteasome assembly chaperone 1 n=2 Tax=Aedes albopictus TaxID=7160 RepID=A0ABM1XSN1_AEDAL|nr:uncharacterized protein LOC109400374 [Aedes albopictus]KXJ71821.1 hypothetical protein RP20_CCG019598 [Aedes albopictus]